jgi:hypothetical protein
VNTVGPGTSCLVRQADVAAVENVNTHGLGEDAMAFTERTWERHHAGGMCERIVEITDAWCEGFIVERGIRSAAGRGTSRDRTGYVMRCSLVHRGHQCSAACDTAWREIGTGGMGSRRGWREPAAARMLIPVTFTEAPVDLQVNPISRASGGAIDE